MDNNTCQINIDGSDYYIPCDRIKDLDFIDGYLVNVSSSSISMKSEFNTTSSYPYVTCSSMSVCNLRSSSNNSHYITSNFVYNGDPFKAFNFEFVVIFLLLLILGVKLLWKK